MTLRSRVANLFGMVPVEQAVRWGQSQNALKALGCSVEQVSDLLDMAVELAKAGIDDPRDLLENYAKGVSSDMRLILELGWCKSRDPRQIDKRIEEIRDGRF